MQSALVLFSGGQDSTTCLLWALKRYQGVRALTIDYGQQHKIELYCAERIAKDLGVELEIIKAPIMRPVSGSSVITGRNTLLVTLAAIYATHLDIFNVVIGACRSDRAVFIDCRLPYIQSLEQTLKLGIDERLSIKAPLIELDKSQVFELAEQLGELELIIKETHTCYVADRSKLHAWGYGCGECLSCTVREQGFLRFKAKPTQTEESKP